MAIDPITDILYPGLSEGPINHKSSFVINAINGASFSLIGSVVELDTIAMGTPEGSLLPEVSVAASETQFGAPTYGIVVGGIIDGSYGNYSTAIFVNGGPIQRNSGSVVALFRDTVRVCTKGICLANLISRTGSDNIEIGDPLTNDAFIPPSENFISSGHLIKASSGDFIIARALQPVPLGTPEVPQGRVAAVNVQREGILP